MLPAPPRNSFKSFGRQPGEIGETLDALLAAGLDEPLVRECLWRAATPRNGRGWFKLIDSGQLLGEVAAADPALAAAPAGRALSSVEAWCYQP